MARQAPARGRMAASNARRVVTEGANVMHQTSTGFFSTNRAQTIEIS